MTQTPVADITSIVTDTARTVTDTADRINDHTPATLVELAMNALENHPDTAYLYWETQYSCDGELSGFLIGVGLHSGHHIGSFLSTDPIALRMADPKDAPHVAAQLVTQAWAEAYSIADEANLLPHD